MTNNNGMGSKIRMVCSILTIIVIISGFILWLGTTHLTADGNKTQIDRLKPHVEECKAAIREFKIEQKYIKEKVDKIDRSLERIGDRLSQ